MTDYDLDRVLDAKLTDQERELLGGRYFASLMLGLFAGFVLGTITGVAVAL